MPITNTGLGYTDRTTKDPKIEKYNPEKSETETATTSQGMREANFFNNGPQFNLNPWDKFLNQLQKNTETRPKTTEKTAEKNVTESSSSRSVPATGQTGGIGRRDLTKNMTASEHPNHGDWHTPLTSGLYTFKNLIKKPDHSSSRIRDHIPKWRPPSRTKPETHQPTA